MSWFKENKFTAIFGGTTVVLAGALGWFVLGAKGELEAAKSDYGTKLSELQGLQGGNPSPNDKNVASYKAELARVDGEVAKLHQALLATEYPLEEVRPNMFQDRLKQTVDKIKAAAIAKKMLLPGQKKDDPSAVAADATFNLGFDYLASLPQDEASSELARELKSIEFVVQQMLDNGVLQLVEVKRSALPSEKKGDKKAEEKKTDDKKPGAKAKGGEDESKLVTRNKFEVKFVSSQSSFMKVLNGIAQAKQPFIIPRRVEVKNEKIDGPKKGDPALAIPAAEPAVNPDPTAPATPAPSAAAPQPNAETPTSGHAHKAEKAPGFAWVVGEENVEVNLELELIDFADAKPVAEPKSKTSK
jgi:hypothetical protein